MRLSVVLPCRDAEAYLDACLESVRSQDMADFEALIVDDGSTDGTAEIAARFCARDRRARLFHSGGAGVSAARNLALSRAAGEWVTFVDADDLLPPGAFSRLFAAAGEGVDLVVGAHETFGEGVPCEIVRPDTNWPALSGERRRRAVALRLIEGDSVLNIMCAKLARREMLEREGIRLYETLGVAEDALFNLEAVLCARGIAYVDEPVYRYRMHAGSKMHTQTRSAFDIHEPLFRAMRAMLARRGQLERYFPALLNSAALRLYKDGGVPGVMRGFNARVVPLLDAGALNKSKLSMCGRLLRALCLSDAYPAAYPFIFPFQLARRKLSEAGDSLRKRRREAGACRS